MADAATGEATARHEEKAEAKEKSSKESVETANSPSGATSAPSPSGTTSAPSPSGATSTPSPSNTHAEGSKPLEPVAAQKPYAVILDFHGTTTPTTLVTDVLLPYIKNNIERYVKDHWEDKRLKKDVNRIRKELNVDSKDSPYKIKEKTAPAEEIQKTVVDYVKWYVDNGKEQDAIVKLMKHMWRDAYENGSIQTPIYEDVAIAMQKWKQNEIKVYLFSANKTEVQKRLFKHTDRGDLQQYIDGYFDKTVGPKSCSSSYEKIVQQLNQPAGHLLYISDTPKEAKAASKAGMKAVLIYRKGNKEVKEKDKKRFPLVHSFLDINLT